MTYGGRDPYANKEIRPQLTTNNKMKGGWKMNSNTKTKVSGVLWIMLIAVAIAVPGSVMAKDKDKIVIGAARPISGPLSVFEETGFGPVYKMWVDEVNAKGGIYVKEYGKKLPVEMKVYDDKSDLGTMCRLLEKLIVEDKVDFVFPPASTAFLFAAGPIACKYNYLLFGAEGGATSIKDQLPALPYFFPTLNFSDWNQIPVLTDLFKGWGVKTVAIMFRADLHGIEYAGVANADFTAAGIKIVLVKSIPMDAKDVSPTLREVKALNPDALCSFQYPPENFLTTKQSIELGLSPKAFILGPGGYLTAFRDAFGKSYNGVIGEGAWSPKGSPALKKFYDDFVARFGEEKLDFWGHAFYWGWIHFFEQAIEKAGTLDQKKIRDIVATQHFNTCLGDTYFTMFGDGGGLLAIPCHPGEIGQWQWDDKAGKCVWEVIGPKEKATATPIYPKPMWVK
jgi:branched-chain amino acid transport system substrate-binding protein